MTGNIYDLIPGLRETEEAFRDEQLEAFTGIEIPICGIEVRPFTPRMFIELDGVENDLMRDVKGPRVEHLAMFLWRISQEFDRLNAGKRARFLCQFRRVEYGPAVLGVRDYLRRTYSAMPLIGGRGETVAVWPSVLVHLIAKEYGWTEDVILDTSFRRIWQYLNRIFESRDPKYRQACSESLRLRAEWLARVNERAAAAQATPGPN
jgi:hypothetical protein